MPIAGTHLTAGESSFPTDTADTASISPGASKLILVTVTVFSFSTANTPTSVVGNGITYALVDSTSSFNGGSGPQREFVYRGMSASPTSGAITITGGADTMFLAWSVDEFDGVDTSGSNGSGAIVQSADNTANPGADLVVTLGAFSSVDNGAYGAIGTYGATIDAPGSGWTELVDRTGSNGVQTQWRADNDTTCDWTHSSEYVGGVAVEIKAAGGGGGGSPGPQLMLMGMGS